MKTRLLIFATFLLLAIACKQNTKPPENETQVTPVTDQNYAWAETQGIIEGYVKKIAEATSTNGVGVFMHNKQAADPKDRTIMRINFDTFYSFAVLDLTNDAVLTMPETNGRYQSAWIISEEHYNPGAFNEPGEHKITQDWVGTRYVVVVMRTQVNVHDPADIAEANALQEKLKLTQKEKGAYVPSYTFDEKEVLAMRDKYMKIGDTLSPAKMFGKKGEVPLVDHNAGTAFGWGGFTPDQAVYPQYFPKSDAHQTLTLKEVPVKAFWSITVYDKEGYPQTDTYNINSAFAEADEDGSVTINFGGDSNAKNYMETFPGWNFTLRLYQPTETYFNGTWEKPELQLVN
jgi:hypothetical protein